MALKDKAMLASLKISQWGNSRRDDEARDDLALQRKAQADRVRVTKQLLPKEELAEIASIVSGARNTFRQYTQPWLVDGTGILAAANFNKLAETMLDFEVKFNQAVPKAAARYSTLLVEQQVLLGGMFKAEDYPGEQEFQNAFTFDVLYTPLTDVSDWRLDITGDDELAIKEMYATQMKSVHERNQRELWDKLYSVVARMSQRLAAKEEDASSRLHESVVTSLVEICDLLPGMNLAGDPELDRLAAQVKKDLGHFDVDTLKSNGSVRSRVLGRADKILEELEGYKSIL